MTSIVRKAARSDGVPIGPWPGMIVVLGPASLRMRSAAAIMPPIHPRLEASILG